MAAAVRSLRIALIPGDGIGREVIPPCATLLQSLPSSFNLSFSIVSLQAGFDTFKETGAALPSQTLETLRNECDGALFGAVSSPTTTTKGYSSPIVRLRKELDLYANVRPVKRVGTRDGTAPVDMVIVRENTEDVYVKEERTLEAQDDRGVVAEATKRITERASRRIATMAAEIARRRAALTGDTPKVTVTHKSNVLPQTDGLFRKTCLGVLGLGKHKQIRSEEQIVDSMVYKLFRQPEDYDVIVAPNLYGDLLSDGAAALVGSLGVVPSANVGDNFVVGEPCHGSAPDIEGLGLANPIASLRSTGCLLEFLGELDAAAKIYKAVDASLAEGKVLSPDLGGNSKTNEVVEDVLRRL
ncbi:MAG: hypothetical protein Q9159_001189 [Coniocarpon cinnabarinum]